MQLEEFLMSKIGCDIEDMRLLNVKDDNLMNRIQYPQDDSMLKIFGFARKRRIV